MRFRKSVWVLVDIRAGQLKSTVGHCGFGTFLPVAMMSPSIGTSRSFACFANSSAVVGKKDQD
jgi:hypothetical protein